MRINKYLTFVVYPMGFAQGRNCVFFLFVIQEQLEPLRLGAAKSSV